MGDCEELLRLRDEIDRRIKNSFEKKGVFVRLSNRSPKDGIPLKRSVKAEFEKVLEKILSSSEGKMEKEAENSSRCAKITEKSIVEVAKEDPNAVMVASAKAQVCVSRAL